MVEQKKRNKCGLQNIPFCHIQITQQSAQSTQNDKENLLSCLKREESSSSIYTQTRTQSHTVFRAAWIGARLFIAHNTYINESIEEWNGILKYAHISDGRYASFKPKHTPKMHLLTVLSIWFCVIRLDRPHQIGHHLSFRVCALSHRRKTLAKEYKNTNDSYKIVYWKSFACSHFHSFSSDLNSFSLSLAVSYSVSWFSARSSTQKTFSFCGFVIVWILFYYGRCLFSAHFSGRFFHPSSYNVYF